DINRLRKAIPKITDETADSINMPLYSDQDYYNDIMEVTGNESDPKLAKHLATKSYETILWMKKNGVEFELNENQYFEKDGNMNFWGGLPVKTKLKGIGLINSLFDAALKLGIDVKYDS